MSRWTVVAGTTLGLALVVVLLLPWWQRTADTGARELVPGTVSLQLPASGSPPPTGTYQLEEGPLWAATSSPNILLISIDTLRPDHLGCYGYPRETSPAIDRLCSEGIVFEQAVVPVPKTSPSLASLLSGLYPRTHRVVQLGRRVPDEVVFVSQLLGERGYETAGFCGQYNCHRVFGFGRGFDHYDDTFAEDVTIETHHELSGGGFHPEGERRAAELVDHAIEWLSRPRRHPTFTWIHFMDPHAGYAPPAPFDGLFTDAPPLAHQSLYGEHLPLERIHGQARVDDIEEYSFYVNHYDGEIRYLDTHLGRLFEDLRRRGVWDDTLVVLTADHGEFMGENAAETYVFNHGDTAFDSEVRAPLVVKLPKQEGAGLRPSGLVSTVDVAPTLLPDVPGFEGRPLERRAAGAGPQIIQLPREDAVLALRWRDRKVVVWTARTTDELSAMLRAGNPVPVRAELYELGRDPLERHAVPLSLEQEPLLADLARWIAEGPNVVVADNSSPAVMSQETADRLRSLGYVE